MSDCYGPLQLFIIFFETMTTSAISLPSPSPYGLKAIRDIKGSRSNPLEPTERLKKKILDTRNYFYEKVDPLVGECITHLLCEQPSDVPKSMLIYFQKKSKGESIIPEASDKNKPARKELKLYLATRIGPVVAKLINRIALSRPENVVDFICTEMVSIIEESGGEVSTENKIKVEENNTFPVLVGSTLSELAGNEGILANQKEEITVPATPSIEPPKSVPKNPKPYANILDGSTEPKNIQVSVIGIGGGGKSTILNILEGKPNARTRPTVGFRPVTMMLGEEFKIRFYDLGGGKKIRDIWEQYYHDAHGVIFVVDSSSSKDELKESAATFANAMMNPFLEGKPILILANKQDKENALSGAEVREILNIDSVLGLPEVPEEGKEDRVTVTECSAYVPEDLGESDYNPDPRIEEGLEALLGTIMKKYDEINTKVDRDTAVKTQMDEIRRLQKERFILKCKIACAFHSQIEASVLAPLNIILDPATIFTKEEGDTFLAAEIGEDADGLPPIGLKIAAAVGYQRLALQMVGAMKVPISKKKEPMTWEQIDELVSTLRSELGLPVL